MNKKTFVIGQQVIQTSDPATARRLKTQGWRELDAKVVTVKGERLSTEDLSK